MKPALSNAEKVTKALEQKSLDELRILARKLPVSGYSDLRKTDLIDLLTSADSNVLWTLLFPSWWKKHHNHVYGALSIVLTITFFMWPTQPDGRAIHVVPTIEMPINFRDYAAMTPADRQALFRGHIHKQFVWEGYLSETIGFKVQTLAGVSFETDVGLQITPTPSKTPQLRAECQFGKLLPTDYGHELAVRLDQISIGQRLRLSGQLGGIPDSPIIQDATLEAVFPTNE